MALRTISAIALLTTALLGGACGGDGGDDATGAAGIETAGDIGPSDGSSDDGGDAGDAGNGGSDSADSGSGDGKSPQCEDLVSKEDADAAFGVSFNGPSPTPNQFGTVLCSFQSSSEPFAISITMRPKGASEYDATANASKGAGAKESDLDGIGDKAVLLVTDAAGVSVYQVLFVKNGHLVHTTVSDDDEKASVDLATRIAARL